MQCITPCESPSWVYVTNELAKKGSIKQVRAEVKKKVFQRHAWLFDLDDTHADSPGKMLVKRAMGTCHLSPSYILWCARTLYGIATKYPRIESKMWNEYVDRFLRDPEVREEIGCMFGVDMIRGLLYPGVEDFCSLLENAKKFYVTRNIHEVAQAYANFLGFDGFYPEAMSKAEIVVKSFVEGRPHLNLYGVEGDSEEDADMVAVLRYYGKDVLGILCSDSPVKLEDTIFDMNVSKDRTGLMKILTE